MVPERIPHDVQTKLCRKAQRGDMAARDRLVAANMGIPWGMARDICAVDPSHEIEDLAMEGSLGLLRAIEKYDPKRGCQFHSYAFWWVGQFIQNAIHTERGIPRGFSSRLFYAKQVQRLRAEGVDREEAIRRVAAKHRTRLDTMEGLVALLERPAPLSLDATSADWDRPMHDRLASTRPSVEDEAIENINRRAIDTVVARFRLGLNERERMVLDRRVLADEGSIEGLVDLAKVIGVCRERVRQIDMRVRTRLREFVLAAEETRGLVPANTPIARHADYDRFRAEIQLRESARPSCSQCKRPRLAGHTMCGKHRDKANQRRMASDRRRGIPARKYRYLTWQGQTLTVTEWARKLRMPVPTLQYRVNQGWSDAKALSTPIKRPASVKVAA